METTAKNLIKIQEVLKPYYKYLNRHLFYYGRPLIWRHHKHRMGNLFREDPFQDVNTFCIFLGHARSGHSIIASLLDAHPRIILSDELDVLKYVDAGFSREQIFYLILEKSRRQAEKGRKKPGRRGTSYSYAVPGQWQGNYQSIRIIGDKKGGGTVRRLASNPELIEQLQKRTRLNLKLIAVMRNPYDNISTRFQRNKKSRQLETITNSYFASCHTINEIRRRVGSSDIAFVNHEAFIDNPREQLNRLCAFLGEETSPEYLDACAGIVYRSPVKSRYEIEWSPNLIRTIQTRMANFDFLSDYSFDA
jgi:hypothetical protein